MPRRVISMVAYVMFLIGCSKDHRVDNWQFGTLKIVSDPSQAAVSIDGQVASQKTPATIDGVTAMKHTVKIDLLNYAVWESTVVVAANQVTEVRAHLAKASGNVACATDPPGAAIALDNVSTGHQTPFTLTRVPVGYHNVSFQLANFNARDTLINVLTNQTVNVNSKLTYACPGNVIGNLSYNPVITIDSCAIGASTISGTARNIDARRHRVVLWALTNMWYIQPFTASPYTNVCGNGRWSSYTHPWARMVALLVDSSYVPKDTHLGYPAFDPGVLAWAEFPSGGQNQNSIAFAGYTWAIKRSADPFDPGPNYWSNDPENVHVDNQGRLHLAITKRDGKWYCPEVSLTGSLGYGVYRFEVESAEVGRLLVRDQYVIFGGFLYESPTREIDYENAGTALIAPPAFSQFVVQPYTEPGHLFPIHFTYVDIMAGRYQVVINWRRDVIEGTCQIINGPGKTWLYNQSDIPPAGGERFHFNLWLFNGHAPYSANGDEVIIRSFTFTP